MPWCVHAFFPLRQLNHISNMLLYAFVWAALFQYRSMKCFGMLVLDSKVSLFAVNPYHLMTNRVFVPILYWCTMWFIVYSWSSLIFFLAHFPLSIIDLCLNSLDARVILVAVRRSASLVPMGKFVAGCSRGSHSDYLDCCEALAPVAEASIPNCRPVNAWSDEIVFGLPSWTIVTVSVVDAITLYGPTWDMGNFEYLSVAI